MGKVACKCSFKRCFNPITVPDAASAMSVCVQTGCRYAIYGITEVMNNDMRIIGFSFRTSVAHDYTHYINPSIVDIYLLWLSLIQTGVCNIVRGDKPSPHRDTFVVTYNVIYFNSLRITPWIPFTSTASGLHMYPGISIRERNFVALSAAVTGDLLY